MKFWHFQTESLYKGQIMDILDAKKATKEDLGLLMAGIHPEKSSKKK
jgi:hypothetical protein